MARFGDLAGSSMAFLMAFVMSLFKALKRSFDPDLFRFEKMAAPRMAGAYNTAVCRKFLADLVNELHNFRFP
jgi:hypothetical protein